jgi:gamma-glutamyltranspeptidase/glutathione hydrolase
MVRLCLLALALLACEPRSADSPAPPASASASAAASAGRQVAGSASVASIASSAPLVMLKAGGAVESARGMVSSEDELATKAGVEVLAAGGNAIDAAIAVAYALAVTHHSAGSLGGGGFMIVHLASGETHAIDYRETAPAKATVALNDKQLAAGAHGYLSAPVPGVVAGLELARDKFGSLPRDRLVAPAIALARDGFPYSARQAQVLAWYWARLKKDPVIAAVLGRGAEPLGRGDRLRQPRLAETLEAIAKSGVDGFYAGEVAKKIADAHRRAGGLVTLEDLAAYRAVLREPLHFEYRGFDVHTMPPPSMGGVAVMSILRTLSTLTLAPWSSAAGVHHFVEASKRAYADRRAIGADPDVVDAAIVAPRRRALFDAGYYQSREPKIRADAATPSSAIVPLAELSAQQESPETTHFSVVDALGNAVACTTTLSAAFGSWRMAPGTGVIFSNAMGAFSPAGVNVLAPGKRMASSMSPTILTRQGAAVAVIGSPGGDTIPGTVAQLAHHLIDHQMTIDEAIEAGRVHHQYLPDEIRMEKDRAPDAALIALLRKMGHSVKLSPVPLGDANGIVVEPSSHKAWGHADSRKGGLAAGPP